jgi:hypothetical protein
MIKRESIIYRTILKLSKETLEKIISFSEENLKGLKRIRETETY